MRISSRSALLLVTATLLTLGALAPAAAQDHVEWESDLQAAHQTAQHQQRLVLLHFWSENCPPCMRLEKTVFKRRDFVRALHANYVPVKVNVYEQRELARQFNIKSIPTDVVLTPQGQEVFRSVSPGDAERYVGLLDQVAAHTRLAMTPSAPLVADASEHLPVDEGGSAAPVTAPIRPPVAAQQPAPAGPAGGPAYAGQGSDPRAGSFDPSVPQDPYQRAAVPPEAGLAASPPVAAAAVPRPTDNPYYAVPVAAAPNSLAATAPPPAAAQPATDHVIRAPRSPAATGQLSRYSQASATPSPNPATRDIEKFLPFRPQTPSVPPAAAAAEPTSQVSIANATATPLPPITRATLALDGFCPVTLVEEARWQPGQSQVAVTYQQRIYWFASPAHAARFQERPQHFAPSMSGYDIVHLKHTGQAIPGKREHGVAYRNQYFLFADEQSLEQFWTAPDTYLEVVQQAYEQHAGDARFLR